MKSKKYIRLQASLSSVTFNSGSLYNDIKDYIEACNQNKHLLPSNFNFVFDDKIQMVLSKLYDIQEFCKNTQFKDKKSNDIINRYLKVSKLHIRIQKLNQALIYAQNNDPRIYSVL